MAIYRTLILLACVGLFGSCGTPPPEPEARVAPEPEAADTPVPGFRLPVSLNEVMVALVNHAADPLWVAAWRAPESDADWRELERRAFQLELAGALIAFPGTGTLDRTWTIRPGWQDWSKQLRDAGENAVVAVQSRDPVEIARAGDRIVEVCEGCHTQFKLSFPTGGKFGELSPTSADFEDQ